MKWVFVPTVDILRVKYHSRSQTHPKKHISHFEKIRLTNLWIISNEFLEYDATYYLSDH